MLDKSSNKLKDQEVAYFDFDGTLTHKDTLLPFLIHVVGWTKFIINLPRILPNVILYLLNVITNEELKERTLTTLLKGYSFATLNKYAKSFAYAYIRDYINPHVFAKLEYHKEHGHKIILVSANLAIYLRHFVSLYQIDGLIATEIEFVECVATGKLATPNCYGAQKVIRICQYLEKNNLQFDYSYGYGNSRGDYELLHYVDEGYMVAGEEFNEWVHDYEK